LDEYHEPAKKSRQQFACLGEAMEGVFLAAFGCRCLSKSHLREGADVFLVLPFSKEVSCRRGAGVPLGRGAFRATVRASTRVIPRARRSCEVDHRMSTSAEPAEVGEEAFAVAGGTPGVLESLLSVSQDRPLEESGTFIDSVFIPSQQGAQSQSWNDVQAAIRPAVDPSGQLRAQPAIPAKARGTKRKKQRQREVELANAELTELLDAFRRGDAAPVIPGERSPLELSGQGDILGHCNEWILGESQHGESVGRHTMAAADLRTQKLAPRPPRAPATGHAPAPAPYPRVVSQHAPGPALLSTKTADRGEWAGPDRLASSALVVAELQRDLARAKVLHAVALANAERQRADAVELLLSRALAQLQYHRDDETAAEAPPTSADASLAGAEAPNYGVEASPASAEASTTSAMAVTRVGADAGVEALRAARAALAHLSRSQTADTDARAPAADGDGAAASSGSGADSGAASLEARMQALHEANVLLSGADYARRMMQGEELG
jgi:hypothetical protein